MGNTVGLVLRDGLSAQGHSDGTSVGILDKKNGLANPACHNRDVLRSERGCTGGTLPTAMWFELRSQDALLRILLNATQWHLPLSGSGPRYTGKTMPVPQKTTLRERKKAAAHAKVVATAHRLFHQSSFDATTLEMICKESSISKRTFFRYFRDKESLIFPHRDERLEGFIEFLSANEQVDNPFDALRRATHVFGAKYNENKDHLMAQQKVILSSQALLAREREIDLDWEQAIATTFSARAGQAPENDLWARVLAGAIMGVVRSTMTYWFDHGCKDDLAQLGLDALNCLEQGFPRGMPTPIETPPRFGTLPQPGR